MIGRLAAPWPVHPMGMRCAHGWTGLVVCLLHAWPQCTHLALALLAGILRYRRVAVSDAKVLRVEAVR